MIKSLTARVNSACCVRLTGYSMHKLRHRVPTTHRPPRPPVRKELSNQPWPFTIMNQTTKWKTTEGESTEQWSLNGVSRCILLYFNIISLVKQTMQPNVH